MAKKREGYLEWDEYFMGVAFLAAQRSKDPSTQVGACIVNKELKIVGVGYNGFPIGCSDDRLPWSKSANDRLETKYPYVCHAELNAIINKNSSDVRGCVMYVTLFPCNECAKLAIQAGIAKIIYLSDKHHAKPEMVASRKLFDMVGIVYERFIPKRKQVVIDFEAGIREEMERSILIENSSSSPVSANKETGCEALSEVPAKGEEEEELAPKLDALDDSVADSLSESPERIDVAVPISAAVGALEPRSSTPRKLAL